MHRSISARLRSRPVGHRAARVVAATLVAASALVAAHGPPAHAAVTLNGAGSTWSQIAVDQWRADVQRQGLNINYQGAGSTAGRVFYYNDQTDFAVSEIPFQAAYKDATGTVSTNEIDKAKHRPYVYLPIVAGGTSFMYHLDVAGQRVRNLKLDPTTLAKIFTGVIQVWNDPAIQAQNPGLTLPSLPIRPVVRADGSGTTAQFTAYMASQAPSIWNAFCQKVGIATNPCPATSLFPEYNGFVAQSLSDGVATFVAAPYNNGAITYVEYGYAKARGFPVASMRNRAGNYTQPTSANVTAALTGATFNTDNTQNLQGVYVSPKANAYPVSSYSYMIAPKSLASPFSKAKGEVLGRFIEYFVCAGQQKAEQLGYSPLPQNLVENAFNAVRQIPGAPAPPAPFYETCANPTLPHGGVVTTTTQGHGPGATSTTVHGGASGASGASGATTTTLAGGGGPTGSGPTGSDPGATDPNSGVVIDPSTGVAVDPNTGAIVSSPDGSGTKSGTLNGQLIASGPIQVPDRDDPVQSFYVAVAILLFVAIVLVPPFVSLRLKRRDEGSSS